MIQPGPTVPARWKDTLGREFNVLLGADRIRLESDGIVLDLLRERWPVDLYVVPYASGFLVRVETFAQSAQFILSQADAAPLLSLLQPPQDGQDVSAAPPAAPAQEAPAGEPATWPKVSPFAVWALICSSLVFAPVAGLLSALVTVVLLVLHRVYVPKTAATSHSRMMCLAAFLFLIAGLAVSATAMLSWRMNRTGLEGSSLFEAAPAEKNWGMIISGILVVVLSLSVHEAAHAITAWWLGDGLAKSEGRVTLNPIAHIDPVGTVLLPVILAMFHQPIFGYARPVPVFVDNLPRYRRAHILISVAGPGSNLLVAAASLMLLLGMACGLRLAVPSAELTHLATGSFSVPVEASGFPFASYFGLVCTLLKLSFVINIALAMFNLIPIPPLDGSWVLEHLFPRTLGPVYAALRPYGFLILVVALYGNVFAYLSTPVQYVFATGLGLLAATTGW